MVSKMQGMKVSKYTLFDTQIFYLSYKEQW